MNNGNIFNRHKIALWSLVFLWVFTGFTSIVLNPKFGVEILSSAGITDLDADIVLYAGGVLDIFLGLWLLSKYKLKFCCGVQVVVILIYTTLLTWIEPNYWIHPFGPITKNIPIIVLIFYVYIESESNH